MLLNDDVRYFNQAIRIALTEQPDHLDDLLLDLNRSQSKWRFKKKRGSVAKAGKYKRVLQNSQVSELF